MNYIPVRFTIYPPEPVEEHIVEWYVENSAERIGSNVSRCCGKPFTYPESYKTEEQVIFDNEYVCTQCNKTTFPISFIVWRNPCDIEHYEYFYGNFFGDEDEENE